MCTSPTLALPSLDLVSIQMRNRPRCQIHVCRSSVLSKLSSKLKLQRSFNQLRWLVLDIYLDFLGCVKSCGRLPDCSVLSPPELALEVIWWNVAFCLLLPDLLLQKRKMPFTCDFRGKRQGYSKSCLWMLAQAAVRRCWVFKFTLFGIFPIEIFKPFRSTIKAFSLFLRNSALPVSCSQGLLGLRLPFRH